VTSRDESGAGGDAPGAPHGAGGDAPGAWRGRAGFELGPEGFRHPRSARDRRGCFTRYRDVTHLALTARQLWIGTRGGAYVLPRARFSAPEAPAELARALIARIAALPGGGEQIAAMAQVEDLSLRPAPPRATWALAAVCVAAWLLELFAGPHFFTVGYFSPALVADGDWWRIFTGTLLHGFPLHLVANVLGLLVLGRLVERVLSAARTLVVMATAAVGAMLTSGVFLRGSVVGVSGVVFGLAGALLWLELRRGAELPAWWRFPRPALRFVLVAFALDVAFGFFVPVIAGEAHLGGFALGALATAALYHGTPLRAPAGTAARALAGVAVACTALSLFVAGSQIVGGGDFAARHAARLSRLPGIPPDELNNHAWFIAIGDAPTRAQLEAALLLAERAVAETDAELPALLDTLAEIQFQLGDAEAALASIDLAIERDPDEPYYREQRRRFTGERAADDRPEDPALRPLERERDAPLPPDTEGVRI
jgi:membrane associated rhomboid family serine protease